MTKDEFFDFCAVNRDIRIERDEKGQILVMPPAGLESDNHSVEIMGAIYDWNNLHKSGKVFGSSAGFTSATG